MNFSRIGGKLLQPFPFLIRVQTDGSYGRLGGRVAAIICSPEKRSLMMEVPVSGSTEAEWASVALGLQLALDENEVNIGLENDNQGVIRGLVNNRPLKHEYARYYRSKILGLATHTLWTGVRWIPRGYNRADDLFHMQ